MEIKLEIIKGADKGKIFTLNEATTCLAGRSKDARFRFSDQDPYISRRHFLLEVSPPNVFFKDLDVTNPSTINDKEVEEATLVEGDIIEVGYTKLKVSIKMDIPVKQLVCRNCGKNFEIYKDEPSFPLCADCMLTKDNNKVDIKPPVVEVTEKPISVDIIKCKCGKDLTRQANSDKRLRELTGNVTYCCDRCLPPRGEEGGKKINDHEVIRKLGAGGMGKVYLSYHKATARILAIKEMNIFNKQMAARFYRERRLMKKLSHNNVLTYIDEGQDKKTKQPYLVMSYASEGSLDQTVKNNKGFLPPEMAVKYVIGALSGLEYIHKNGIVHRDLKPENIFLGREKNGELIPKIADFGLSRQFSNAGGSILTRLGSCIGTILYMPPEQIKDTHTVREPADLYSMGVTLYYLLTGKYTFNFPSPLDVLLFLEQNRKDVNSPAAALKFMMQAKKLQNPHLIVLSDEPIPIRTRKPTIPVELANLVDKAVKKEISQRFHSAAEFRDQLEHIATRL